MARSNNVEGMKTLADASIFQNFVPNFIYRNHRRWASSKPLKIHSSAPTDENTLSSLTVIFCQRSPYLFSFTLNSICQSSK